MAGDRYTFVVEHLDPELGPWSSLEYRAIAQESRQAGCDFILSSVPASLVNDHELQSIGAHARSDSIETYFSDRKARICLLDPAAPHDLGPSDAMQFDVFLFGGILGMEMNESIPSHSIAHAWQAMILPEV